MARKNRIVKKTDGIEPEQDRKVIMLTARALKKSYPDMAEPAVNGIDIEVDAGEIFGILGPNGAGKTTTISILCTLMLPDHGDVVINGINARKYPARVRKDIGLVPQEIALYPELTARENLRFFGKLYGIRGKELKSASWNASTLPGWPIRLISG